jgi:hypothetical protein
MNAFTNTIESEINSFISSKFRNTWILFDEGKVYVRNSMRRGRVTFDIASVEIEEEFRNKGYFKKLLRTCISVVQTHPQFEQVCIELVQSDILRSYLDKFDGWIKVELYEGDPAPSYFYTLERSD